MAKAKLSKKKETREEFDERVKNSVLKPTEEYQGYLVKVNEIDTFDIYLNELELAGNFETVEAAKKWIDDNISKAEQFLKDKIPSPPPRSDQGPESGIAHRIGIVQQELTCILTPEEIHDRAIQLAKMFVRINDEKARQSQIKRELNVQMDTLEKEWADLSTAVQTGEESRMVDVAIELLGDGETVSEIRQDTLKPVNTRPATDYERQGNLWKAPDLFNEEPPYQSSEDANSY